MSEAAPDLWVVAANIGLLLLVMWLSSGSFR